MLVSEASKVAPWRLVENERSAMHQGRYCDLAPHRSKVQSQFSFLQSAEYPNGRSVFFFLAKMKGFVYLRPSLVLRVAAQITKQSRVDKLACQRGARRLLRERCDIVATQHEVPKLSALWLARSKVHITAIPIQRDCGFCDFVV